MSGYGPVLKPKKPTTATLHASLQQVLPTLPALSSQIQQRGGVAKSLALPLAPPANPSPSLGAPAKAIPSTSKGGLQGLNIGCSSECPALGSAGVGRGSAKSLICRSSDDSAVYSPYKPGGATDRFQSGSFERSTVERPLWLEEGRRESEAPVGAGPSQGGFLRLSGEVDVSKNVSNVLCGPRSFGFAGAIRRSWESFNIRS
jgi:hypothetical protein